eukprot:COSAG06_NODE_24870_length_650_cov_1.125227_2_plen_105_part_01
MHAREMTRTAASENDRVVVDISKPVAPEDLEVVGRLHTPRGCCDAGTLLEQAEQRTGVVAPDPISHTDRGAQLLAAATTTITATAFTFFDRSSSPSRACVAAAAW